MFTFIVLCFTGIISIYLIEGNAGEQTQKHIDFYRTKSAEYNLAQSKQPYDSPMYRSYGLLTSKCAKLANELQGWMDRTVIVRFFDRMREDSVTRRHNPNVVEAPGYQVTN